MNRLPLCFSIAALFIATLGCDSSPTSPPPPQQSPPTLRLFVSILPQVWLVESLGGDRVLVEPLVQPGHSPETYNPTPQQIARLAKAHAFIRVGVPFEHSLIPRIESNMPDLRIVDPREGIQLRDIEALGHEPHDAQDTHSAHEHSEAKDPHIWLDPNNMTQMAETIRDALIELDPQARARYENNYESTIAQLHDLDREIRALLQPYKGRPFFVFHPAYGYFAEAYGLTQRAIETGGKQPTPRDLQAMIEQIRRQQARVIFVQPQFDQSNARAIAEAIKGSVVTLDPLPRDYPAGMRVLAQKIAEAFSANPPATESPV